jgi:hypothetical protein
MDTNGNLADDLHSWAVEAAYGRQPDLVRRAVEAAFADSCTDRTWALVRLAADLRAMGRHREALDVLDIAWWYDREGPATAAMFSVGIACHCDTNQHLTGHVVAVQQPDEIIDLKLARAACRLYWELLQQTGEECWQLQLDRYRAICEQHGDAAASLAVSDRPT